MHRAAAATQWRTGRNKKFVARGRHTVPGKFVELDGCSHEAIGVAIASPGFTTSQGRRWVCPHLKAAWLRHPRTGAAPVGTPSQARSVPNRQGERSSRIGAGLMDCGVDGSGHGGRPVGEPPSFLATCPPALGTVRHCTTGRSKVCRTPASRPSGWMRFGEDG